MKREPTVPSPAEREFYVTLGIKYLRKALFCFTEAGAPKTTARVRLALSSAQGAQRNAWSRQFRQERATNPSGDRSDTA